jgi:hypothetical protein
LPLPRRHARPTVRDPEPDGALNAAYLSSQLSAATRLKSPRVKLKRCIDARSLVLQDSGWAPTIMKVLFTMLADFVVVLHLGFVLFVVLGGLLTRRWRWIPWLHLPAAAWGVFVEVTGRICPLTPLEQRLRSGVEASAYEGDFVERYLIPIVYPPSLTREVQVALAAFVILVNVAIYTIVWRRRPQVGNR